MKTFKKNMTTLCIKFLFVFFIVFFRATIAEVGKLSFCSQSKASAIFVSTLDGKLAKISENGDFLWAVETKPGPLVDSTIQSLDLMNNGQLIRIIPSLTGMLYKFDGQTVDPISISAESLMKSSFRYSDNLIMAGSMEVATYGIGAQSGNVFYECSSLKCENFTENSDIADSILLLKRTTKIVRAVDVRTGTEKWNFSVGNIEISTTEKDCINQNPEEYNWDISAIMPEGLLEVTKVIDGEDDLWQYKFSNPIVKVWKWESGTLEEINLFLPKQSFLDTSAALYIGMHNKQLYIHESRNVAMLIERMKTDVVKMGNSGLIKIPWKPVPASNAIENDISTAVAILYGSTHITGNGLFLYTENDIEAKDPLLCAKNQTIKETDVATVEYLVAPLWFWWKEIAAIAVFTAIISHVICWLAQNHKKKVIEIADSKDTVEDSSSKTSDISSTNSNFTSRYMNDFETLECLGKGGFGIVFHVKQKFDECQYALKRITLPNEPNQRNRVMREVKALANLEHQNIVRYFNSWVEHPPDGWQHDHDTKWILDSINNSQANSITVLSTESLPEEGEDTEENSLVSFRSGSTKSKSLSSVVQKTTDVSNLTSVSQKTLRGPPTFLYIQMQLCQKESLKDWLLNNQDRSKKTILDLFRQILSAVEYVHLQGLIHRDLKPGNIFFSLEGQIKVGDFGLVKYVECPANNNDHCNVSPGGGHRGTHTKNVGTYLYMSPEQIASREYSYKVDIYALGMIFFELLIPMSTESERIHLLTDLKMGKYPKDFLDTNKDECNLIKSMLCKDPKERFTTIGIRAQPPFKEIDSQYGEKYYYELNRVNKKKSN